MQYILFGNSYIQCVVLGTVLGTVTYYMLFWEQLYTVCYFGNSKILCVVLGTVIYSKLFWGQFW